MTRLYLTFSFVFVLALLVLAVVVRTLGGAQPPNPALRGFVEGCEDKPQPCWYGIVTRTTSVEAGHELLRNKSGLLSSSLADISPEFPCSTSFVWEGKYINRVQVKCRTVYLGDWINQFGMPDGVGVDHAWVYDFDGTGFEIKLAGRVHPYTRIEQVWYPVPFNFHEPYFDWRGFSPHWRYCQLETDTPVCR